jgi:hypothetical protein
MPRWHDDRLPPRSLPAPSSRCFEETNIMLFFKKKFYHPGRVSLGGRVDG